MENRISLNLTSSDISDIDKAIGVLVEKLLPALIVLTNEEKKTLAKMGDKTIAMVGKALSYTGSHAQFNPQYLNVEEFRKDFEGSETLSEFLRRLQPIIDALNDTIILCGSEALRAALIFYGAVSAAAKMGVPEAQTIYDDLRERFEAQRVKARPAQPSVAKNSSDASDGEPTS